MTACAADLTRALQRACLVQPIVNSLVVAVSQDDAMLTESLRTTCQVDEFTAGIFKVRK